MISWSEPSNVGLAVRLVTAAAAALLGWMAAEPWYPFFATGTMPELPPNAEDGAQMLRLAYLNAAALTTMAGTLIAAALVRCETVRRSSSSFTVVVVLAGAVLGGVGGDAGGCLGQTLAQQAMLYRLESHPLLESLGDIPKTAVVQAVCWSVVGLGTGLGLALAAARDLRSSARLIVGGALGGMAGGLAFPIVTAFLGLIVALPDFNGVVPDSALHRLLWLLIAAISIATGVGRARFARAEPRTFARSGRARFLMSVSMAAVAGMAWQFQAPKPSVAPPSDEPKDAVSWQALVDEAVAGGTDAQNRRVKRMQDLAHAQVGMATGQQCPDLRATGWLNGRPQDLRLRGKVTVVDVWDDLCLGCRQANPYLRQVFDQFGDRGVLFVGLSSAEREAAEEFVSKAGLVWPNGYGAKETVDQFCGGKPTIFVIGRDGRVKWTDGGSQYSHNFQRVRQALVRAIDNALSETLPLN